MARCVGRQATVDRTNTHIRLSGSERGESIQHAIKSDLRKSGAKLMMLFKKWDADGSNTVSKSEFRRGLKELKIRGGVEDYDSLFDAWDTDKSGSIGYTELLDAMKGRRYDTFHLFDADLGNAKAKIAAAAAQAYLEATAIEAAEARALAERELVAQRTWLLSRWRAARQGVRVALEDMGETAVGAQASMEAVRLTELALVAHLDLKAEKQLRAEDELKQLGLCHELLDLESSRLVPLVAEMAFARVVGASSAAFARLPPPAFHGPQQRASAWLRMPKPRPAPSAGGLPVALVVVCRHSEELDWLSQLMREVPGLDFHLVQQASLQPGVPIAKQTLVSDVGGPAYAYLSFLEMACKAVEAVESARVRDAAAAAGAKAGGAHTGSASGPKGTGGTGPKGRGLRSQSHVVLSQHERKESIQAIFHAQLRQRGVRVQVRAAECHSCHCVPPSATECRREAVSTTDRHWRPDTCYSSAARCECTL